MKKRILSLFFAVILAVCCLPVNAFAEGSLIENKLNESHKGMTAQDCYDGIDEFKLYNPCDIKNVDPGDPFAEFAYWHFVDTSKMADHATVSFKDTDGKTVEFTFEPCKSAQHYAVITPVNWTLLDGTSYSGAEGNFVLSHSGNKKKTLGKVKVTANVDKYHNEYSPYEKYERDIEKYYTRTVDEYYERPVEEYYVRTVDEYYERTQDDFYERTVDEYFERTADEYYERDVDTYYERTVDDFYERTVDDFYERTVDKYYERTAQDVFVRPVYEIYTHKAQEYYIPTFARRVNSYCGTLVTRLDYSDNTKKAVPVNGGAFNNGHTYVAVNVAEASKDGGVWYEIADSSKNNGKKTPDQYNRPIGYRYNVQIKDGKLIISCDENDFVSSVVGAYVVTNPKKFPGNAPKHFANGVTVDLPAGYGDTVYLYTHFEKVEWYPEPGKYEFVGWEYDKTEFGDYEFDHNDYGDYAKVDTVYGEYELADTVYGDYELADTVYGDYELADTVYGDYELVNTQYSDYELVDTKYGDYVKNEQRTQYGEYLLNPERTVNGEYVLKDTVYGEYALQNKVEGAYALKNTVYGNYNLVKTVYGEYELVESGNPFVKVSEMYTGGMTLTVNGEEKPLNETFVLAPGDYKFVLTSNSNEFDPITKDVTIVPGDNDTVDFGTITVQTADVVNELDVTKKDRQATIHKSDLETVKHYADDVHKHNDDLDATRYEKTLEPEKHYEDLPAVRHEENLPAEKHYSDRAETRHDVDLPATRHEADLPATRHEADKTPTEYHADVAIDAAYQDAEVAEPVYVEEYEYLDPIYLGDENDPDGEYAKKLN